MERTTIQTNSGTDSSGQAFGIEAKHFVPILYALMLSLACYSVVSLMPATKEIALWMKLVVGFSPFLLSMVYVACFVVGKPPHFQKDVLESQILGPDFNVEKNKKLAPHPMKALRS